MNTKRVKQFAIEDGPKDSGILFDACRHAYNPDSDIYLDFKVAIAYTGNDREMSGYIAMQLKDVSIVGIEHEGMTGHKFNFNGYCKADLESLVKNNARFKSYRYRATYNTDTQKGSIDFFL